MGPVHIHRRTLLFIKHQIFSSLLRIFICGLLIFLFGVYVGSFFSYELQEGSSFRGEGGIWNGMNIFGGHYGLSEAESFFIDIDETNTSCLESTVKMYKQYAATAAAVEQTRSREGMLRIAGFSRLWIPPLHATGGMQFHAFHIYSQLAARGHYVHVFVSGSQRKALKTLRYCTDPNTHLSTLCNDENALLVVQQIASTKDGEYSVEWLKNCQAAFHAVHAKKPFDVIHSESWSAVPNIFQLGVPFAVTWHGSMLDWFRNELNYIVHNFHLKHKMPGPNVMKRMQALSSAVALEEYMLLTVPHHIVISDVAKHDLINIQHIPPERVELIYNGVNRHLFRQREGREVRNAFLTQHHVPLGNFIVGCGGRLEAIKGHLQLSTAMRLIMKRFGDVTLLVAGDGNQKPLYQTLRAEGFSVVMLGMLNQENLAYFYQSLDVFVDPFYQYHGLNTVMIEAALSGVPLVVTDLGSARSVVPCKAYGRRFPLGNVPALVREILYYKVHPEKAAEAARNARERAMHLFGSDTMASQYESLFYRIKNQPVGSQNITGKLVCNHVYPALCYREVS
ncbi:putative glycosyl transferase-like [Trypanosoma theileri]|uniref:Putative glycosyl transferase-like n=1 Tax=Trypanosoma theileri TaxID=67003 RepID=A0A1X0P499_9TRYP|nr:putative glycosyl transferase-like [Trypanosoma theileri]ORC91389.1 putative glycosyl transferase-like [Trypanosoma theileri]